MRLFLTLAAAFLTAPALAQPLTTAFTYQGELKQSGTPATGTFDLQFKLFDASSAGNQVGLTQCADNVTIAAGRFTTLLDFGAVFTGQKRFLEVSVRADPSVNIPCATPTGYTTLIPRQELTASPNAAYALTASAATLADNSTQLNGKVASYYLNASNITTGTLPSAMLAGNYTGLIAFINPNNIYLGNGSNLYALNASNISGGLLNDTILSGNIPRLNATNIFSDVNKFTGVIHSTSTGYRFPDDTIQKSAALDPGKLGFSSGYPAGTTVQITLNNTVFPTARMVGSWRINRPTTGGPQWSSSLPTFRRPRTSDNTWFNWILMNVPMANMRIAVIINGGQYNYDFPAGRLASYRLLTSDDGLPFEEITYFCAGSSIPSNTTSIQGAPVGVAEPGVTPRLGETTGNTNLTYRPVFANVRSDVVRVVGDPNFIIPIDPSTGQQTGQIGSTIVTLRCNSLAVALNLDSSSIGRNNFRLVLHPTTGSDIDLTNTVSAALTAFIVRIADDGLPVEEYEVTFPFNPPP